MSKFNEEDSEVQNLMEHAPMGSTPAELKANLRLMATAPRRAPSVWPARLAMAGIAVIAATAIVISMVPAQASARTFQRVVSAVDDTRNFSFTMKVNDGGKTGNFVMSGTESSFNLHVADGTIMEMNSGRMRIYDAKKNEVTVLDMSGMVDLKDIAKEMGKELNKGIDEMDIKKMLKEYEAEYGKENIRISPLTQRFGKTMYDVDLQKPGEPERVHISVNADTDLPEQIQVEKNREGGWSEELSMELRFGSEARTQSDAAKIPADAKVIELNIGKMMEKGFKEGFGKGKAADGEKIERLMEKTFEKIGR
jgi:hypothetical protein